MMTFCNGTVDLQSLLHPHHHQNSIADGEKPADVLESAAKQSPHFSSLFSTSATMMTPTKRDPGGIGFIDEVGGRVDGLMSCTESLGFESSDERRVDDQIENLDAIRKESMVGWRWKRDRVKRERKNFPPPLSSLNQDGKPTFFLRPVRKDGKLELQEVKISRPEILRASRQDGRLRLHLIKNNEDEDIEDREFEEEEEEEETEEVKEEEEEEEEEEEKMQEIQKDIQEMVEEKIGEEEEEERVEGWQIAASPGGGGGGGGGGEGYRRCHEQVSHHQNHRHHHHHDLHVWRQHCVTIR